MLEDPQLAPMALSQLAAWEAIAEDWLWTDDLDGYRLLCVACGKSAMLLADSRHIPYRYTHEQELALKVLHLRNHHADLDPDK